MIRYIYDKYFDLNVFADAKIGGMSVLAMIFATIILSSEVCPVFKLISASLTCVSLLILSASLLPKIKVRIFFRNSYENNSDNINILKYYSVSRLTIEEIKNLLSELDDENLNDKAIMLFASQLLDYSKIIERKFMLFNVSMIPLFLSFLFFLISLMTNLIMK